MDLVVPDPEWTALEAGLKPAVRIALRAADASHLAEGLRSRGAAVVVADRRVRFGERESEAILYVAKSSARAEALRDAEARTLDEPVDEARREAHRELGRLLGYPPCCVDAYLRVTDAFAVPAASRAIQNEDFLHARAALANTHSYPHARINPLLLTSRIRLVTYYPCRYDCPAALAYADALHAAMARKDRAAAEALDAALACTVLVAPDGARAIVTNGHAKAPPRPIGMRDDRGDRAFAAAWERGDRTEGTLRIEFRV